MKQLNGSATATVAAPRERCLELLGDVEHYPAWHGDVVRRVEIQQRGSDGTPTVALADLHAANVPLLSDFRLQLAVEVAPPGAVSLTRIPHDSDDPERFAVRWQLREEPGGTRVQLQLEAELSVPRLVPVGGLGDSLARSFVQAAQRALEGGTG